MQQQASCLGFGRIRGRGLGRVRGRGHGRIRGRIRGQHLCPSRPRGLFPPPLGPDASLSAAAQIRPRPASNSARFPFGSGLILAIKGVTCKEQA